MQKISHFAKMETAFQHRQKVLLTLIEQTRPLLLHQRSAFSLNLLVTSAPLCSAALSFCMWGSNIEGRLLSLHNAFFRFIYFLFGRSFLFSSQIAFTFFLGDAILRASFFSPGICLDLFLYWIFLFNELCWGCLLLLLNSNSAWRSSATTSCVQKFANKRWKCNSS